MKVFVLCIITKIVFQGNCCVTEFNYVYSPIEYSVIFCLLQLYNIKKQTIIKDLFLQVLLWKLSKEDFKLCLLKTKSEHQNLYILSFCWICRCIAKNITTLPFSWGKMRRIYFTWITWISLLRVTHALKYRILSIEEQFWWGKIFFLFTLKINLELPNFREVCFSEHLFLRKLISW